MNLEIIKLEKDKLNDKILQLEQEKEKYINTKEKIDNFKTEIDNANNRYYELNSKMNIYNQEDLPSKIIEFLEGVNIVELNEEYENDLESLNDMLNYLLI